MAKRGRKKIEFDPGMLERACAMFSTLSVAAGSLKISEDTLERRCKEHYGLTFKEVSERYSANTKLTILQTQVKKALNGDTKMLIHLGKVYLGQNEKLIQDLNISNGSLELNIAPAKPKEDEED